MWRTVADETPRPADAARTDEAIGSPDAMYWRTSAARTRFDRSFPSIGVHTSVSNRRLRLLNIITSLMELEIADFRFQISGLAASISSTTQQLRATRTCRV